MIPSSKGTIDNAIIRFDDRLISKRDFASNARFVFYRSTWSRRGRPKRREPPTESNSAPGVRARHVTAVPADRAGGRSEVINRGRRLTGNLFHFPLRAAARRFAHSSRSLRGVPCACVELSRSSPGPTRSILSCTPSLGRVHPRVEPFTRLKSPGG